jgi:hypothetical protein
VLKIGISELMWGSGASALARKSKLSIILDILIVSSSTEDITGALT